MRDWLFPRTCASCNKKGDYLCKQCKKNLKSYNEICPICYKFSQNFDVCLDCKADYKPEIKGIIIGFFYNDFLKKLILKLKYNHTKDISNFLAQRMAIVFQTHPKIYQAIQNNSLIISSIPAHRHRKYFVKGYNQSEVLAQAIAKELNVHFINILKKNKNTKSQVGLTRQQRMTNLNSVFELRKNLFFDDFRGKTLVFVDDITTTGATIQEVSKLIKLSTIEITEVYGAVVAKK